MKQNNIFADAEEKYVKNVLVYADADDGHLFYDAGKTQKINKDDLLNLFLKGLVIFLTDEYLIPVAYKESAGAGVVTAVHESVDSAATLNFYSAEHEA